MMQAVFIKGRRWFDKVNGNTYCSAEVFFDNELVAQVPMTYGYGSYYAQAATEELVRLDRYENGAAKETLRQYFERKGVVLYDEVTDGLKRELLKERTL